jgi:hypothetical protein
VDDDGVRRFQDLAGEEVHSPDTNVDVLVLAIVGRRRRHTKKVAI